MNLVKMDKHYSIFIPIKENIQRSLLTHGFQLNSSNGATSNSQIHFSFHDLTKIFDKHIYNMLNFQHNLIMK